MGYAIKEIFKSLQGEGALAGRVAVFCRFAGCNLWSGREADRQGAMCDFCDTDFVGTDGTGGGRFANPQVLANTLAAMWGESRDHRFVVFTGGEPLLQLDARLIAACHSRGFVIAVETNGTRMPPDGIDWLTVSPKAHASWTLRHGAELKLVYPQPDLDPAGMETLPFQHFFLQPMDGPEREANTAAAAAYCLAHPRWRLSLQTHKLIGLP
jgi:7-carboxy-7-deazaguanine synthase (Cx14CxxC type)